VTLKPLVRGHSLEPTRIDSPAMTSC